MKVAYIYEPTETRLLSYELSTPLTSTPRIGETVVLSGLQEDVLAKLPKHARNAVSEIGLRKFRVTDVIHYPQQYRAVVMLDLLIAR